MKSLQLNNMEELNDQQKQMILDLLNDYLKQPYITKTDQFIAHDIIKLLTKNEL